MHKDTLFEKKAFINCNGKYLDLNTPRVMGILNLTPDSFYDGGRYLSEKNIKNRIHQIMSEGADIIDVGAYSSRPGAGETDAVEELKRLDTGLNMIRSEYPEAIISVDTYKADVAYSVVKNFGVDIINDISAGDLDDGMFNTILELNVPYIMMHMRGTPRTMQNSTEYDDLVKEIIEYLAGKAEILKSGGLRDVIVDPGFGFGKSLEQNYQLLYHLDAFKMLELPILVGLSRKSMIFKFFDITPDDALNATTALNMYSLKKGANILRVHDVKEANEVIKLYNKIEIEGSKYLNSLK